MGFLNSIKSRFGDAISKGGLCGILGGLGTGIVVGTVGLVFGGPMGALGGFLQGVKLGAPFGMAIGTAIKALKVPVLSNLIDWGVNKINKIGPIRAINNWIRTGVESIKLMGAKSDIEYLMAKLKNIVFKLLTVVVNALGKNNEKVVEQTKEKDRNIEKSFRGRQEKGLTKRDRSDGLAKATEQSRQKQNIITKADRSSREKASPVREPVHKGARKTSQKSVTVEGKRTGRLSQVPVKRQPVKDLSQVIGKTAAPAKPIIGKSSQAKELTKVR